MIAGNVDVWFAGMAGGAQPKKPDAAEDFLD